MYICIYMCACACMRVGVYKKTQGERETNRKTHILFEKYS